MPGVNGLNHNGDFWPEKITSIPNDERILKFIEDHLWLIPLDRRVSGYSPYEGKNIHLEAVKDLAKAADDCWEAVQACDYEAFGKSIRDCFDAQVRLFPNTAPAEIREQIDRYKSQAIGWKLSGAGGGGYLVLVSDQEIPNALKIRIRRG